MGKPRFGRKKIVKENKKSHRQSRVSGSSIKSTFFRKASNRAVAGEEIIAAIERLRQRGTWADQYKRTKRW